MKPVRPTSRPAAMQTRSSSSGVGKRTRFADEPAEEEASRKQRAHERRMKERKVLLYGMDQPFQPVMVDMNVLRDWSEGHGREPATWLRIQRDPPDATVEGYRAWHLQHMSRAMLVAFVQSLTTSQFILPEGVSYHEALTVLEYEGISVPHNDLPRTEPKLPSLPTGLGFRTDELKRSHVALQAITDSIAHALLQWPRLAEGMRLAGQGLDQREGNLEFTCTCSRAWLALGVKPPVEDVCGPGFDCTMIKDLAKKRVGWFNATLQAIGMKHWELGERREAPLDLQARTEPAFCALAQAIDQDPTHQFLVCKRDMPRAVRAEHPEMSRHSDRFCWGVLNTVAAYEEQHGADGQLVMSDDVQYAFACCSLACRLVKDAPAIHRVFAGSCMLDVEPGTPQRDRTRWGGVNGYTTKERRMLEDTLNTHGIRILKWEEGTPPKAALPLVFPPSYVSSVRRPAVFLLIDLKDAR